MIVRADRSWFARPSIDVAQGLIGQTLIHETDEGLVAGRIVETEAYLGPADAASHAALYRNGVEKLGRAPGTVYMYRAYGVHSMFNIVSNHAGDCDAVLIRAVAPIDGVELMRIRRGPVPDTALTRGPGNLCQAMGFRLDHDGLDVVVSDAIRIELIEAAGRIECSPRIGITKNADPFLRYYDPDSPFVSGPRKFRTGVAP